MGIFKDLRQEMQDCIDMDSLERSGSATAQRILRTANAHRLCGEITIKQQKTLRKMFKSKWGS